MRVVDLLRLPVNVESGGFAMGGGITFRAWSNTTPPVLLWSLDRVLQLTPINNLVWRVADIDCAGEPADVDALTRWAGSHQIITGVQLLAVARRVQLLEGQISGYRRDDKANPVIAIRCVRGDNWDITATADILTAIKNTVERWQPLPR